MTSRDLYEQFVQIAQQRIPHLLNSTELIGGTPSNPRTLRLLLRNGSFLDSCLTPIGYYSFHWDHTVLDGGIHRWDNAPHYPSIETHPHHFHDSRETNVTSSHAPVDEPLKLFEFVLAFILTRTNPNGQSN